MAYIPGTLTIERVIRPNAVEELLCLKPDNGGKAIIFDLDIPTMRAGLCEFIKECNIAKTPLRLETNGGVAIPQAQESRFEFYREFYGLTRWAVIGVDILQTSDEKKDSKDEKKSSGEENKSMRKLEPEPAPVPKKPKPKISKKLEPKALNVVPASIVWIAEGSLKKPTGPHQKKINSPLSLSLKLGGHKVGLSHFGLGRPASGLKSLGGMSR